MTDKTNVLAFKHQECEVTATARGDGSGWSCRVSIVFPANTYEPERLHDLPETGSAEEAHAAAKEWARQEIHRFFGIRGKRIVLG